MQVLTVMRLWQVSILIEDLSWELTWSQWRSQGRAGGASVPGRQGSGRHRLGAKRRGAKMKIFDSRLQFDATFVCDSKKFLKKKIFEPKICPVIMSYVYNYLQTQLSFNHKVM